jgi:hypothetical protein
MVRRAPRPLVALVLIALGGSVACGDDDAGPVTTCLSHPIDGNAYASTFDLDEVNELLADAIATRPDIGGRLGSGEVTTCGHALAIVDLLGYGECSCE